MVVLLRSPRSRAEGYARVFADEGIGLLVARRGLFAALEVQDLVNLLRVLDNPQQDLPLLGVLRSPLVGLTPDQLTLVRLALPKEPFWLALQYFAGQDDGKVLPPRVSADLVREARRRIGRFLERHARWRAKARTDSLSACLETVLDETAYEPWLLAQEYGAQRQANVARLLEMVRQAGAGRDRSLYHFLQSVDELAEVEYDPEPASVVGEDAVRLMSIHQSKGLEFPVVVLAGLGTRFNTRDLQAEPLRDEEYGLCLLNRSEDGQTTWPSLPYALARNHLRREQQGEELRLLYVGMTRACDRLILAGSATPRQMAQWAGSAQEDMSDRSLLRARCALDWFGPWLERFCGVPDWLGQGQGRRGEFAWRIGIPPLAAEGDAEPQPSWLEVTERELLAAVRQCDLSYEWTAATLEPAKASVSALRRRAAGASEEREHAWLSASASSPAKPKERPSVAASSGLTAAERGTAHHRFLQGVDLALTNSAEELREEANRMRTSGELTAGEAACLDFGALASFWASELGQRIRAAGERVHREMPFTVRLTPSECREIGVGLRADLADQEYLVVQGVVDLVVLEAGEFWLLDFKTDYVSAGAWGEKEREYKPQLLLYAIALQKILKKRVGAVWLHFILHGQSVRLDRPSTE
jgi:ATP-dependent helicase/nuclease subunit A